MRHGDVGERHGYWFYCSWHLIDADVCTNTHYKFGVLAMIEIFPGKKNLHISEKVLAIVLALTLSIFHSPNTAAGNSLILDNNEPGTSSTGRWRSSKRNDPYGKNYL